MDFDEAVGVLLLGARVLALHLVGRATVIVGTVVLPVRDPVDEHLAYLHIGNWHFLDRIHFECRRMQHLFDRAGRRLEHTERDHGLESQVQLLLRALVVARCYLRLLSYGI